MSNAATVATNRTSQGQQVAANDTAGKKGRLSMPDFIASVFFENISAGFSTDGTPYYTMQGCNLVLPDGREVTRTVMAFGQAHDLVRDTILGGNELVAFLSYSGSTLKVVGVQRGSEMVMVKPANIAKAA